MDQQISGQLDDPSGPKWVVDPTCLHIKKGLKYVPLNYVILASGLL